MLGRGRPFPPWPPLRIQGQGCLGCVVAPLALAVFLLAFVVAVPIFLVGRLLSRAGWAQAPTEGWSRVDVWGEPVDGWHGLTADLAVPCRPGNGADEFERMVSRCAEHAGAVRGLRVLNGVPVFLAGDDLGPAVGRWVASLTYGTPAMLWLLLGPEEILETSQADLEAIGASFRANLVDESPAAMTDALRRSRGTMGLWFNGLIDQGNVGLDVRVMASEEMRDRVAAAGVFGDVTPGSFGCASG